MALDKKVLLGIAEKSFEQWAAAPVGAGAIAKLSETIPKMEAVLALGSEHAAKKRLWKAAEEAVQDTGLGILIEGQAKAFPTYPGIVAGLLSPHSGTPNEGTTNEGTTNEGTTNGGTTNGGMPSSGGSFSPDVYALPRFLVKEYALRKFAEQKAAGPFEKLADLLDVDAFIASWVDHFDAEYIDELRLKKEPAYLAKEAVSTAPNWLVYGYEADFEWKTGAVPGHFFLSHDTLKPGQKPGGKERKEAETNVVKLETDLAGYDLNKRAEIVAQLEKYVAA
jgi:hypothetical protein